MEKNKIEEVSYITEEVKEGKASIEWSKTGWMLTERAKGL